MKKKKAFLLMVILTCVLFVPVVYAGNDCVLGPKVTKDLTGVLNIIRIVAPLILFAMTLFETIKALAKGDGGADFKNVFNRLKKRFIYLILLIFIPTIVQLMLNAMGLTSNCELENTGKTVGEQAEIKQNAEEAKKSACAAHNGSGKKNECEANGCSFNASSNTCVPK